MSRTIIAILLLAFCTCTFTVTHGEVPWPEHPRPDFERAPWINLNGEWCFEFDPDDRGMAEEWFKPEGHELHGTIIVPFPWESRLSGIGDTEYRGVAWYGREITLPAGAGWLNRDCWLVIGACDWEARVWINGDLAREHVGGYVPFDINLSNYAQPGEKVAITIRVADPTDPHQPTGKQIGWYTRTSGIWQTVYLEARGRTYIHGFSSESDIEAGAITYEFKLSNQNGARLILRSPEGAFPPVQVEVPSGSDTGRATIKVDQPQLWTPDNPRLYQIVCECHQQGDLV